MPLPPNTNNDFTLTQNWDTTLTFETILGASYTKRTEIYQGARNTINNANSNDTARNESYSVKRITLWETYWPNVECNYELYSYENSDNPCDYYSISEFSSTIKITASNEESESAEGTTISTYFDSGDDEFIGKGTSEYYTTFCITQKSGYEIYCPKPQGSCYTRNKATNDPYVTNPALTFSSSTCNTGSTSNTITTDNRSAIENLVYGTGQATEVQPIYLPYPIWTSTKAITKTRTLCSFVATRIYTSGNPLKRTTTDVPSYTYVTETVNSFISTDTQTESYYTTETSTDWTQTTDTQGSTKVSADTTIYTTQQVSTTVKDYNSLGESYTLETTEKQNIQGDTTTWVTGTETRETTTTGGTTTTVIAKTTKTDTTATVTAESEGFIKTDTTGKVFTSTRESETWLNGPCELVYQTTCLTYSVEEVVSSIDQASLTASITGIQVATIATDNDKVTEEPPKFNSYTLKERDFILEYTFQPTKNIQLMDPKHLVSVWGTEATLTTYPIIDFIYADADEGCLIGNCTNAQAPNVYTFETGLEDIRGWLSWKQTVTTEQGLSSWTQGVFEVEKFTPDYNETETETIDRFPMAYRPATILAHACATANGAFSRFISQTTSTASLIPLMSSWETNATKDSTDQLSHIFGYYSTSILSTFAVETTVSGIYEDKEVYCTDDEPDEPPPPPEPPPPDEPDEETRGLVINYPLKGFEFQVYDQIFDNREKWIYEESPKGYIGFGDNVRTATSTVTDFFAGMTVLSAGETFKSEDEINIDFTNIGTYGVDVANGQSIFITNRCENNSFGSQIGTTRWSSHDKIVDFSSESFIEATYTATVPTNKVINDVTITKTTATKYATYTLQMTYKHTGGDCFQTSTKLRTFIPFGRTVGIYYKTKTVDQTYSKRRGLFTFMTIGSDGTSAPIASNTFEITDFTGVSTIFPAALESEKNHTLYIFYRKHVLGGLMQKSDRYQWFQGARIGISPQDDMVSYNYYNTRFEFTPRYRGYTGPDFTVCPIIGTNTN